MLPLSSLHPEDEGNIVLQNISILPHYYMLSQPTRLQLEFVLIWLRNLGEVKFLVCGILQY